MVEIFPFRGIRYSTSDIEDKVAPPYDIISEEMRDELYEKSPYNIVRLTLGKEFPTDDADDNRYLRARNFLKKWLEKGILIQSKKKAIYPYQIEYEFKGKKKVMNGFFALVKLDPDYKKIRAHEKTLSKPKEDRLRLMRACSANLEPIELLYPDKIAINELIKTGKEKIEVRAWNGINRLWEVTNEDIIKGLQEEFKEKILFIADGHHRYQTSINHWKEGGSRYRMAIFVNMDDPGLEILPTHRMFDASTDNFFEKAKNYFHIEKMDFHSSDRGKEMMNEIRDKKCTFALYSGNGHYFILILKDEVKEDYAKMPDVSVFHSLLEKMEISGDIKYTRDEEEAISSVDEKKCRLALLLNPIKMEEFKSTALKGEYLPQKSTYFLPKMLSGLVFYSFD